MVSQRPVTEAGVQIMLARLQINPDRLCRTLTDQTRKQIAAPNGREASYIAENLSKEVGPMPSSRKGCVAAGRNAADHATQ